jgi:hypothetical protein
VFDFGAETESNIAKAAMAGIRIAMKAESGGLIDFEGDTFMDADGVAHAVKRTKKGTASVVIGGKKFGLKQRNGAAVLRETKARKPRKAKR